MNMLHLNRRHVLAIAGASALATHGFAHADEATWAALKIGGASVLVRHALAPGTFDPPGFKLDDCSTQRNLNDQGREEAQRIGRAFFDRGVKVAKLRSSPWCRCVDTARLAFEGRYSVKAEVWSALGSPRGTDDANHKKNVAAVRADLLSAKSTPKGQVQVLVTHMFNIQDILGVSVAPGEMVVVRAERGEIKILGRLIVA